MVRGNSKIQLGRRGKPNRPESNVSKQTESRKSNNNKYLYSGLDEQTPTKQPVNNATNTNTTPQIRSARLSAKQNSLIKQSGSTKTPKTNATSQPTTTTRTSSRTNSRSTKKRKSAKWESSSDDEGDFQVPNKRRSAYFEAYQNSSYYDDDNNEDEDESEEEFAVDECVDEESIDNGSDNAETAAQTTKNYPWERAQRPNSPPQFNETNLPALELPDSSQDLLLTDEDVNEFLMQICSVYEILKHFKHQLRLSSFRIEEFIAALQLDEMNSLCSEIHITLLKVLIKEDELNSTIICSNEVKDSINIHLYSCDSITWPEVLKLYLLARAKGALLTNNKVNEHSGDIEAKRVVQAIYKTNYPIGIDLGLKLSVLQYLCDSFLETNVAREEILNIESMTIKHDDHCRKCHKLGDLLCCDNCPSVWHLGIVLFFYLFFLF